MPPECIPSSSVRYSSVRQKRQEEGTEIFWKGGGLGQTAIDMRKTVPGGSRSPLTCSTAASLGFLGLTCGMEQLLSLLLGTCEFPVPGGWREKQIKKGRYGPE